MHKVNISYRSKGFGLAAFLATILNCQAGDPIQVYTVPKEHPPMQLAQTQPAAGSPDIPVNSAPITWKLPEGWKEKPSDGIRLGSFDIPSESGGKANVAITSFPGSVGTELGNVNRWRGELALAPIGENDLASEAVTVDSFQGKLYDIAGASARTVVAVIPRNGSSWFIKLRGDSAAVAAAKPAFLEFLKSVRFAAKPAQSDPHAGLGLQGAPNPHEGLTTPHTSADAPKWQVPGQWVETTPTSTMILKSFSVSGGSDAKGIVTISFFPGEVGGVLANVNRWRGQLGLPPVEEGQLGSLTESLETAQGKATLTDMVGADARTGQPARLVAAIVPQGGKTWFYKLMGNSDVVGRQKNTFVEFVKTVQYP
jgi:hypothetical protein